MTFTPEASLERSRLPSQALLNGIADNPPVQRAAYCFDLVLYEREAGDAGASNDRARDDDSSSPAQFHLTDATALERAIHEAFPTKWLRWSRPNGRLRCGRYETPLHASRAPTPVGLLNLAISASVLFRCADQAIGALGRSPALKQMIA